MGGDSLEQEKKARSEKSLNPPRPHGRGPGVSISVACFAELKSTPPAWAGTE